jgi:uncharacterized protein
MIVGVTHTDCEGAWDQENVAIALGYIGDNSPPIINVNANEPESVANALVHLVHHYMQVHQTSQSISADAMY